MATQDTTFEKHYSLRDLCVAWGLGRETLRKVVMNEPGVLIVREGLKKCHSSYRVPESVARRIHTRLVNQK